MNCPHCDNELSYDWCMETLRNNLQLASDASYINANVTCPHEGCEKDIEFYYPLKEVNGEPV